MIVIINLSSAVAIYLFGVTGDAVSCAIIFSGVIIANAIMGKKT